MKYICSLVVVEDIKRSRLFYEKILGQTVKIDFGENITFNGDFAIHQKNHYQKLLGDNVIIKGSNNFELYFEDDDLESIVLKLKDNGIEFLHEIIEQPWRQRVIRFYDYDKNIIEVGERLEHLAYRLSGENYSKKEISKIIGLPEEVVHKLINDYSKSK
ncbi:MAG: VOC family protein [Actinobacteria bacterium]|nr:VOC family protein [Actinomycetota bacterium]